METFCGGKGLNQSIVLAKAMSKQGEFSGMYNPLSISQTIANIMHEILVFADIL